MNYRPISLCVFIVSFFANTLNAGSVQEIKFEGTEDLLRIEWLNSDTVKLKELPLEITSFLELQSLTSFMASAKTIDDDFCKQVKSRVGFVDNPGLTHLKTHSLQTLRELNNIRYGAKLVPFADLPEFKALIRKQQGGANGPIFISNPYRISEIKVHLDLEEDALTRRVGDLDKLVGWLQSESYTFNSISSDTTFVFKQADLICDLISGKAHLSLEVSGYFDELNENSKLSPSDKEKLVRLFQGLDEFEWSKSQIQSNLLLVGGILVKKFNLDIADSTRKLAVFDFVLKHLLDSNGFFPKKLSSAEKKSLMQCSLEKTELKTTVHLKLK